jgi:hypothetical protein
MATRDISKAAPRAVIGAKGEAASGDGVGSKYRVSQKRPVDSVAHAHRRTKRSGTTLMSTALAAQNLTVPVHSGFPLTRHP